jgi:Tripartite tricarboxylate transporter TctA family
MYLGNIVGLVLVLTTVPVFASILRVPFAAVAPIIVVSCPIGAYAIQNAMFDIWLMLVFGVVGYVFKKIGIPLAPLTLALVLGSRAEDAFRLAMIGSGGDIKVFWSNTLVGSMTTFAIFLLFWPVIDKASGQLGQLWRSQKFSREKRLAENSVSSVCSRESQVRPRSSPTQARVRLDRWRWREGTIGGNWTVKLDYVDLGKTTGSLLPALPGSWRWLHHAQLVFAHHPQSSARGMNDRIQRTGGGEMFKVFPLKQRLGPGIRAGILFLTRLLLSHHLALAQRLDFVRAKAELGQNLFGLLAELRRPRRHLAWGARQRDRLGHQADVAAFLVWHVPRHSEMLDLRVVEHLVD